MNEYYQVFYKSSDLTICGWRISNRSETVIFIVIIIAFANTNHVITINFNLEHMFPNDVIIYDNDEVFRVFNSVVAEYKNVFIDSRNIIDISKKQ